MVRVKPKLGIKIKICYYDTANIRWHTTHDSKWCVVRICTITWCYIFTKFSFNNFTATYLPTLCREIHTYIVALWKIGQNYDTYLYLSRKSRTFKKNQNFYLDIKGISLVLFSSQKHRKNIPCVPTLCWVSLVRYSIVVQNELIMGLVVV